jgi:hypothetical protein
VAAAVPSGAWDFAVAHSILALAGRDSALSVGDPTAADQAVVEGEQTRGVRNDSAVAAAAVVAVAAAAAAPAGYRRYCTADLG